MGSRPAAVLGSSGDAPLTRGAEPLLVRLESRDAALATLSAFWMVASLVLRLCSSSLARTSSLTRSADCNCNSLSSVFRELVSSGRSLDQSGRLDLSSRDLSSRDSRPLSGFSREGTRPSEEASVLYFVLVGASTSACFFSFLLALSPPDESVLGATADAGHSRTERLEAIDPVECGRPVPSGLVLGGDRDRPTSRSEPRRDP